MSKDAPDAPDYAAAAEAQAQSSREVTEQQTWANRPTQNTPFGQSTWDVTPVWDPSTGQYLNTWEQNINLTPESQEALDAQLAVTTDRSKLAQSLTGRMADEFGQPMGWDDLTALSGVPGTENLQRSVDGSDPFYQKAEDAIYNKWSSRQEPRMQREAEQLRTQLYNTGLREGDKAYDDAMSDLRLTQNDAREQATFGAISGAGDEAQRMQGMDISAGAFSNSAADQAFNQNLTRGNFQNQTRQQELAEQMQRRGFSLNEINAILSGQQVGMPSMPSFTNASASQPVQALQAAQMTGQSNLDAYNAQQQGVQGLLSGGASAAMMFSDRRLKRNISPVGVDATGNRWYKYQYLWSEGWHVGVMADEVNHEAVVVHPSGYLMVDYGRL